jgi:hypothetical protein
LLESELSPAILQAISEVVTWCSGKPLRSQELDPSALLDIPEYSHAESIEAWIAKKRACYHRATSWINETRSELLKTASIQTVEPGEALFKSKLLIYEPHETVHDGAAEAASRGFYDIQDAPPWDTWILHVDHAVFCCIPDLAIGRAQVGIDANPVDCIHWADWSRLARIDK